LTAAATADRNWTLPLLQTAGKHLDYVSIHGYWLRLWRNNTMPDYLTCIMKSEGPEETIVDTIGILDEAGYRGRIKIAFDEWNLRGWHHPGFPRKEVADYDDPVVADLVNARDKNSIASQYSMADALFTASFLNACLRHCDDVGMANIAPIVNTRGPLYVHPDGIVRRTTFHALAMFANLLGERVVEADIEAGQLVHGDRFIPVVDGIVTIDDAGRFWSIGLVNRHPSEEVCCTVELAGTRITGEFDATVLAGDSPDAYNDVEHPNRVVPEKRRMAFREGEVRLPAHSLTIVRVPPPLKTETPPRPRIHLGWSGLRPIDRPVRR
jgi:alpha-N-arabinofuranosidase